jgi:hypothetical protein
LLLLKGLKQLPYRVAWALQLIVRISDTQQSLKIIMRFTIPLTITARFRAVGPIQRGLNKNWRNLLMYAPMLPINSR